MHASAPSDASPPNSADATNDGVRSIRFLGTPVACATYDSALEKIKALASEPRPTAVCPSNTHILGEARHNPEFARVLARFDLVLPDGMPVVWALNVRGAGLKDRVYGPYFMRHASRNMPRPWRHFFLVIPRNASSSCDACWSNCNRISRLSECLVRRFGPSRRPTR